MALTLEIISEHREIVGDDAVREFSEGGGTIGRSLQNDWILPDPDRYISGRHAAIDHKGGIYYLADLSSNGVYINDENEPIGKGNPRRLFNGDRLRLGDFEITVSIDQGESIVMPLEEEQTVSPDPLEQVFDEVSLKSGVQLIDEEAITDDEAFNSRLFSSDDSGEELYKPENPFIDLEELQDLDEPKMGNVVKELTERDDARPKLKSTRVNVTSDDLFDTFLDGLGASRTDFHASVDPVEVMQNAGEVLKEFVGGMNKLLISRANLKTAFSLDQTTVLPRHNNPLKLSENTMDSIMQLLVGREGEYLGPRDAVREVCRDLLFHQDAFLEAMSASFVEFADRFEPEELKAAFERSIDSKPLFSMLNTVKYWQLYCDLYPVMTERGGGRFPQMFAEEFVRSYERQINDFKRLDPSAMPPSVAPLEPLNEADFEEFGDDIDDDFENDEADQAEA
jgi:type VI secretion system FHA domain protein